MERLLEPELNDTAVAGSPAPKEDCSCIGTGHRGGRVVAGLPDSAGRDSGCAEPADFVYARSVRDARSGRRCRSLASVRWGMVVNWPVSPRTGMVLLVSTICRHIRCPSECSIPFGAGAGVAVHRDNGWLGGLQHRVAFWFARCRGTCWLCPSAERPGPGVPLESHGDDHAGCAWHRGCGIGRRDRVPTCCSGRSARGSFHRTGTSWINAARCTHYRIVARGGIVAPPSWRLRAPEAAGRSGAGLVHAGSLGAGRLRPDLGIGQLRCRRGVRRFLAKSLSDSQPTRQAQLGTFSWSDSVAQYASLASLTEANAAAWGGADIPAGLGFHPKNVSVVVLLALVGVVAAGSLPRRWKRAAVPLPIPEWTVWLCRTALLAGGVQWVALMKVRTSV